LSSGTVSAWNSSSDRSVTPPKSTANREGVAQVAQDVQGCLDLAARQAEFAVGQVGSDQLGEPLLVAAAVPQAHGRARVEQRRRVERSELAIQLGQQRVDPLLGLRCQQPEGQPLARHRSGRPGLPAAVTDPQFVKHHRPDVGLEVQRTAPGRPQR
jgi:hypothetical protein